ncbi:hypothetical protein [Francisella tularensis]|uniref:hypothetical protein n=1 Tax=Francisella tularensis TaxID=263 RepID=UPI0008F48967|nr:hypothetical protein [Francisella tularensis]APA83406.1 hypothetical protein N894_1422 [Francisella tularensis subsp. novicida PA10-7858]
MENEILDIKELFLEFDKHDGLEEIVKNISTIVTKFNKDKKVTMPDLLKINILTSKLLADQIIQMNLMIDENFDPENDESELLSKCFEYASFCLSLKNRSSLIYGKGLNDLSDKDLLKKMFDIDDEQFLNEVLNDYESQQILKEIKANFKGTKK